MNWWWNKMEKDKIQKEFDEFISQVAKINIGEIKCYIVGNTYATESFVQYPIGIEIIELTITGVQFSKTKGLTFQTNDPHYILFENQIAFTKEDAIEKWWKKEFAIAKHEQALLDNKFDRINEEREKLYISIKEKH